MLKEEGVRFWNGWRKKNPDIVPNLVRADLSNESLGTINLSSARLSFANLQNAFLQSADLTDAHLECANLKGAILRFAKLGRTNLQQAVLDGANLKQTYLAGAKLNDASLIKSKLASASLGTTSMIAADLSQADLTEAQLDSANLYAAKLIGTNLSRATLTRTSLCEADLTRAYLFEATLGLTVFANTCLTEVQGLEQCIHRTNSIVDHLTVARSENLPRAFLRDCGLPDQFTKYLLSHFQYYSCFISYSSADHDFAVRLQKDLQGRGIRCWRDEHEILPGDDIMDQIDRGIKLWDKVLLCCSEASLTSPWVNREIDKALKKEEQLWKERNEKILALIPLNLDNYLFKWTSSRASILTDRHAEDLVDWTIDPPKVERAINRIESALRTNNRGRQKPPKSRL
jgi:uncharacterized protein YjbI with pentapeptide repeats